jgi:hypothetical protein
MEIETDSKDHAISAYWGNKTTPQLKRVRLLSVRTETLEGGVVVRKSAHFSGKLVKRPAVATGGKRSFAAFAKQSWRKSGS